MQTNMNNAYTFITRKFPHICQNLFMWESPGAEERFLVGEQKKQLLNFRGDIYTFVPIVSP